MSFGPVLTTQVSKQFSRNILAWASSIAGINEAATGFHADQPWSETDQAKTRPCDHPAKSSLLLHSFSRNKSRPSPVSWSFFGSRTQTCRFLLLKVWVVTEAGPFLLSLLLPTRSLVASGADDPQLQTVCMASWSGCHQAVQRRSQICS